jgi:uncharacterized protein YceH (UPF0502 family)
VSVGPFELSAEQIRVLGCLLEKQRTTPDAYPLSLNSLRLACNQSTNRDPVVEYDEATIRDALHRLERRGLARLASGAGSRAAKYRHLLAEALPMDRAEEAVMCVLMLRGPQTPGELKQRGERMHPFESLADVNGTLERLMERRLAERLARRPGQKEERFRELLGGGAEAEDTEAERTAGTEDGAPDANGAERPAHDIAGLEERIERLEREVAELRARAGVEGPAQAAPANGGV